MQREAIQLAYYDGLTYAQVSERLSANLATIKSRMRDAIRGCVTSGAVMTEPMDPDLIALATPYALHAVTESELADIERRLAAAPRRVAGLRRRRSGGAGNDGGDIGGHRSRAARTPAGPGADHGDHRSARAARGRLLAQHGGAGRGGGDVIGLGALGGEALRPAATPSTAEQVFAAPDVRTVSGDIPAGAPPPWCSPARRTPGCW